MPMVDGQYVEPKWQNKQNIVDWGYYRKDAYYRYGTGTERYHRYLLDKEGYLQQREDSYLEFQKDPAACMKKAVARVLESCNVLIAPDTWERNVAGCCAIARTQKHDSYAEMRHMIFFGEVPAKIPYTDYKTMVFENGDKDPVTLIWKETEPVNAQA